MNHLKKYSVPILFILINVACSNEDNPTTNPQPGNILFSSTFEKNGQASSDGWSIPTESEFNNDVPPNGGSYSLMLKATWGSPLYAERKVATFSQSSIYNFSFWAKYKNKQGQAILSQIRDGDVISESIINVVDTLWSSYSIVDTFDIVSGDSILVRLTGGLEQIIEANTHFDLCKLEAVD